MYRCVRRRPSQTGRRVPCIGGSAAAKSLLEGTRRSRHDRYPEVPRCLSSMRLPDLIPDATRCSAMPDLEAAPVGIPCGHQDAWCNRHPAGRGCACGIPIEKANQILKDADPGSGGTVRRTAVRPSRACKESLKPHVERARCARPQLACGCAASPSTTAGLRGLGAGVPRAPAANPSRSSRLGAVAWSGRPVRCRPGRPCRRVPRFRLSLIEAAVATLAPFTVSLAGATRTIVERPTCRTFAGALDGGSTTALVADVDALSAAGAPVTLEEPSAFLAGAGTARRRGCDPRLARHEQCERKNRAASLIRPKTLGRGRSRSLASSRAS